MLIIYRPDGAPEQTWEFDPQELLDVEATAIERVTGWTYGEFGEQFIKGSILARKALLWVLRKRTEPTLKFRDVAFRVRELDWKLDADERAKAREAMPDLAEDEQAAVQMLLDAQDDGSEDDEARSEIPKAS